MKNMNERLEKLGRRLAKKPLLTLYCSGEYPDEFYTCHPWEADAQPLSPVELERLKNEYRLVTIEYVYDW